jgi:hypothetical protein
MNVNGIIDSFFKRSREELSSFVNNELKEEDSLQVLKIKDAFDSEKSARGGCSSCRLRALMSKYRPILSSMLKNFSDEDSGLRTNEHGEVVNERGETKRQNRRRRAREKREKGGGE